MKHFYCKGGPVLRSDLISFGAHDGQPLGDALHDADDDDFPQFQLFHRLCLSVSKDNGGHYNRPPFILQSKKCEHDRNVRCIFDSVIARSDKRRGNPHPLWVRQGPHRGRLCAPGGGRTAGRETRPLRRGPGWSVSFVVRCVTDNGRVWNPPLPWVTMCGGMNGTMSVPGVGVGFPDPLVG